MPTRAHSPRVMFHGLDAMRGVAAISVMIYHFSPFLGATTVLPGAYLAVDLFFVLSGFVICHSYELRLQSGLGLPRFLLIRMVRLYPLYIAATVMGLLYLLARTALLHELPIGMFAMLRMLGLSAVFLPNFADTPGGLYPLDLAAWSLFFEIAANVIYAASVHWLTQRRLLLVIGFAAVGLLVTLAVYGSLDVGMTRRTLAGGAARVLFSFGVGVLLCRARGTIPGRRIEARFALEALLLAPLAAFVFHPAAPWGGVFDIVCITMIFPVAVLMGARIEPILLPRVSGMLGYLSYPVYVLHTPLLLIAAGAWKSIGHADPNAGRPTSGAVFVLIVLIASYAITRYYDVPLRAYLSSRVAQSKSQTQSRRALTTPSTAAS